MPNLQELTDILKKVQATNLVTWIPAAEQLPPSVGGDRSETMFLALAKHGSQIKPDILLGWYDYDRGGWRTNMAPIDRVVTHWQEKNYPGG